MPFHDLNLIASNNENESTQAMSFLHELGYTVIALSTSISGKLPPNPTPKPLPSVIPGVTMLTRLTLTISDPSQNHRLASLQSTYDIIALRPTEEKSFTLACTSLECDLISLDLSQRIPFILRFKTVSAALKRGIRFEICYSPGLTRGSEARRNLISGATALIRATRGRGLILSSEARGATGCRAPWDIINLAAVWSLGQDRAKEAVCEEAAKVVRLAQMKRQSYRGVVQVIDGVGSDVRAPCREEGKILERSPPVRQAIERRLETREVVTAQVNGVKRKASNLSIDGVPTGDSVPVIANKPISKRQQKKMARSSATQTRDVQERATESETVPELPIKHETLAKKKRKG